MTVKQDQFITIETPNGRTYGECTHAEVLSIRMINGQFVSTLHIKDKPKRLSREDALHYYTQKLKRQWHNVFVENTD